MAKKGGKGLGTAMPWRMDARQVFPPCASFGLVPASNPATHPEEEHELSQMSFMFQAQLAPSTPVFTQHLSVSKQST